VSHPRITRNLAVPVLLLVSLTASACGGKLLQAQELDGDASNNMARMTGDGQTGDDATSNSVGGSSGGLTNGLSDGSSSSQGPGAGGDRCSVTCTGCCDAKGVCNTGTLDTACGSGGASCIDCTQSRVICNGQVCGLTL
jgi:hypothetical protein